MVKMHVEYTGEKHCRLTHGPSGTEIETDAPKDNQGKGERFSPTDLMGAALASCILTTIAIVAERDGISIVGATADTEKEMHDKPRRIRSLKTVVHVPSNIPADYRAKLERVAHQCPVHQSLNPEIDASISIIYDL